MDQNISENKPSTFKYILAWFLAGLVSNILLRIMDTVVADLLVSDLEDFNIYFIVIAVLTVPIISGSFILIYNLFSTLNIKKVMIYIYILGGFGTLVNFGMVSNIYAPLGVDLSVYYISSISAFIASVYIIRSYYIKKEDRWY